MRIIDLSPEHESLYFVCLEDWSAEMQEAGNHKETWYRRMKARGLRVKLAEADDGMVGGMIHYLPIEESFVQGSGLYFINCIWVHGHKSGRGDFQKRGMGKALLKAAEEDAISLGAEGIAAWGLLLPVFMRASWFKRQGYRTADRLGLQALVWKQFSDGASPPRWVRQARRPARATGRVEVTVFRNGWCPAMNIVSERARRVAAEFGDKAEFVEYDTSDRAVLLDWGISDALFVDGKQIRTGPPPPYEKIRRIVAKRVRQVRGRLSDLHRNRERGCG